MEGAATCLRDRLLIQLLFRLGCRVSEALAIRTGDVDFARSTVIILHLKTRIKLSCPKCKARLAKRHQFCPGCGEEVNQATKRQQEQRRIRTLPVDNCTVLMLKDYISNPPASSGTSELVFRLNRHATTYISYPSSHISRDIVRKIIPRYGKADSLYSRQASREIPETTSLEVP